MRMVHTFICPTCAATIEYTAETLYELIDKGEFFISCNMCDTSLDIPDQYYDNDFNMYQIKAFKTATYYMVGGNVVYPAMGLAGEAGEVCDKIKKHWRNYNTAATNLHLHLTDDQVDEIVKEIGDVLWYCAALSTELGVDLSDVARINLEKLYDRRERNVIKGEGDDR